ncbi:hypothetical protein [Schleiferilactobacillus shenzhenensis]|uniref:Uncharacterized protein n=1 Tax=Schleiferilactobacillus shenzhenensis LY-73 TaxID=1231336 RepID=U4TLG3_9LACO|nr:hypothetical protein [Schleiferilactobacillus shenzhenensis]ERL64235.1 hypothetical protein L248_1513 [Schleiferilactobacillus shenzhenensis LY-73]
MYPARLLLNEQSAQSFTENPALYCQYVQKVGERFYERTWYFLQHLVVQNGGLVLGAVVSILLAWRFPLQMRTGVKDDNTFLALGFTPMKQYWLSMVFDALVAFLFSLVSIGSFVLLSARINGWGALNYPVLLWRGDPAMYSHAFANLGTILKDETLLFSSGVMLSIVFSHVVGMLIKQPLVVLLTTIDLWAVPLVGPSWRWAPWTYLNFSRVADGYTKTFYQSYDVSGGIAVLLGWTAFFIILGCGWLTSTQRRRITDGHSDN